MLATVKTLLSRLVAKGAITTTEDGRRFLYAPAVQRADIAAGALRRWWPIWLKPVSKQAPILPSWKPRSGG